MVEIRETATFRTWLLNLHDYNGRARIAARIRRLGFGHVGDARSVGDGVHELRLHVGPGYRVYFTNRSNAVIILLCGGDKSSQSRDIAVAKALVQGLEP